MIDSSTKLAIIVPAFKAKFLRETLSSIDAQTSKRFNLYICDDCSPEPIGEVVQSFENRLPLTYNRFENNLGSTSLTKNWERCIAITSEEWVWLFSDDDIMEPTCVEEFYDSLGRLDHSFDVFRFNTIMINGRGEIKELNAPHPAKEDCLRFLYFFLKGLRDSMMQDHIFSRKVYERYGGFPDFPFAWCSDQAQVLRLGAEKGFSTLANSHIRFRQSGLNISSSKQKSLSLAKVTAAMFFSEWLLNFLDKQKSDDFPLSKDVMKKLVQAWLIKHLMALHIFLDPQRMLKLSKFCQRHWNEPLFINLFRMFKINLNNLTNELRQSFKN